MSQQTIIITILAFTLMIGFSAGYAEDLSIRQFADTTGFARDGWQVDKLMERIREVQNIPLEKARINGGDNREWKLVISPHDDHAYVGYLYPALLRQLKAKTVILFGVAHKAKDLGLEDRLIFDDYKYWHGPYGPVKVSGLREDILKRLPHRLRTVNGKMHKIEHSLEALIPFIQYYNRDVKILPILVPSMDFNRISEIGKELAAAIAEISRKNNMTWGKDFAMAISSDSVHYGNSGWGGKNYDRFGTDRKGYRRALDFEQEIIRSCLAGNLTEEKVRLFTKYTVKEEDHRQYKWTWCGRYSIPAGLMTALHLSRLLSSPLQGVQVGYRTSITLPPLEVKDLKMGLTAPAALNHWVGYAALGYR